jgi:hypothetical protein
VRRKFKEAAVFRTAISSQKFLRPDNSVDLYKAREYILNYVSKTIGEVRDYNGGMITKLNISLDALKAAMGKLAAQHHLLLEKFFHAITPIEMRNALETEPLKQLFLCLLHATKIEGKIFKQDAHRVMAVMPQKMDASIGALGIEPHKLVSFSLDIHGVQYVGYMYLTEEKEAQEKFLKAF